MMSWQLGTGLALKFSTPVFKSFSEVFGGLSVLGPLCYTWAGRQGQRLRLELWAGESPEGEEEAVSSPWQGGWLEREDKGCGGSESSW